MNGLLDDGYMDPVRKWALVQGLLSEQIQGQNPVQSAAPVQPETMPQQSMAPTPDMQTKPVQSGQLDLSGLLSTSQDEQKKKWMLPVALGLLNMGAGMSGPYYPGQQSPPWARGVQGMTQGIMAGTQLQKAQQDEMYKQVQTMLGLKKAFGQGQEVEVGGKKGYIDPSGRFHQIDKGGGTKTEAERLAEKYVLQGMSEPEALALAHKTIEGGKTAGKPEHLGTQKDQLIKEYMDKGLSREDAMNIVNAKEYKPEVWYNPTTDKRINYRPNAYSTPPEGFYPMGSSPMAGIAQSAKGDEDAQRGMLRDYVLHGKAGLAARGMTGGPALANISKLASRISAEDIGAIPAQYQALSTGMKRLEGQRTLIEAFTNNAKLNMELANKISDGVNRLGIKTANNWLMWYRRNLTGEVGESPDKDVSAFHAIVRPLTDEIARITSTATGGGQSSEEARKAYGEILTDSLGKGQFKNVGAILMKELDNRGKGYQQEEELAAGKMQKLMNRLDTVVDKAMGGSTRQVAPGTTTTYPEVYKDPTRGSMKRVGYDKESGRPIYQDSTGKQFLGRQ